MAGALVRLVACGSVDDGKSTLIGRLLVETGSVPVDQVEAARAVRRGGSTIPLGEIDFSLVTDGLESEREQGITVDVAYRQLALPDGRRVILADAPGHEQYTRNMAVAASTADVALLLVDAVRGVRAQTHRHLTVCALMGVRSVVVAVNKLDAVGLDRSRFEELVAAVRSTAGRLGVTDLRAVPVSATDGDNVTTPSPRTPWYDGPTVLELIASADSGPTHGAGAREGGLRFPVQTVVRDDDGFRGYAGTVVAGAVRTGDKVVVAGRGIASTVARIVTFAGDLDAATAGSAVTLVLADDVDVSRGDLLADADTAPDPADRWSADLVWTGDEPMAHGRSYLLVNGSRTVPATLTALRHRLDVTTGVEEAARVLQLNEIGQVELATDVPIPMEPYDRCRDTGGFLLVDRVTADTVAAGMVRFPLRRSFNVVPHEFALDRAARSRLMGHPARVAWLTGLSGSGKSTIADAAARQLHGLGVHAYVLDGDALRTGLTKDLGFTAADRAENVRRAAEAARLLHDAGLVVLACLVSPFEVDRAAARELFDDGDFVEVFVDTPLSVCRDRDPKGLYAKAERGELPNLTGVGQAYEPPADPDLVLDGTADPEALAAALVARLLDG